MTTTDTTPDITAETNAAVVRRFLEEVVNRGNADLLGDLMTADYTLHGGSLGNYQGLPAYRDFLAANGQGAFTRMHLEVTRLIAQGDEVFVLFTNSGSNTGAFIGMPATNRSAKWNGTALYRLQDGRIAESTYVEDILHLLLQLGITQLPISKE